MTDMKKIIAVDDNPENLLIIKNTLKNIYEVYPTTCASKMFELLEHIQPDLILLDVGMPVMNGYEAAKKLKSDDRFREIPIIFLTLMSDAKSEIEGLSLGAIDYIHSPFVAPLFLQRIKTHLSLMEHQKILLDRNREIEELLELKTKEVALREAAELEAQNASRAKSEFLSHMSHEIRSPLNAVIGMITIAMHADDIHRTKYFLERAENASKHVLGVINDILDMSKIEANKLELSYREFDFEKMLIGIINMTGVRAEGKHQNFTVNLNTNVPPFIITDELRLSQIITNLLTNAIKFTPENGKVTLSVQAIEDLDGKLTLRIEVADTGIGISEEQQERLFTSYNQAYNSITNKFGGTGLGLTISKQIVDLMQGRIWIESELNKGSKFIFTIKAEKGTGKTKTKLSSQINKDTIRILAVEDCEETKTYFAHVMEAFDLPCDTALNGAGAIDLIKNCTDKPYNIFFVDWQLPDTDGIELTKKIKEMTGDKSSVIMFTMTDWSNIEEEAISAGVRQFIPKPVFPSILINAINSCFETESKEDSVKPGGLGETSFNFKEHTILIAEDVEFNREILIKYLEKTGISIDFAGNGSAVVSMFKENHDKYSLILMDIHMPGMDGYEATRAIRALKLERAKDIPIIAMTASVFREDIEKCLSAGMNDHIGKPIFPKDIYEKLQKYLC
ncbi:MAG: response regulator [Treponema sp.]|jgi:CheY-like chemotaxis protein|nr:response regulator [Treponema sp.]